MPTTDINSAITNWILKTALSQGGVAVRWIVGLIISAIASQNIVPKGDLTHIQAGLTQGGMALLLIAYAYLQLWISNRNKAGVKVIQTAVNNALPSGSPMKAVVDGIAGNQTLAAFHSATPPEVNVPKAIGAVLVA